MANAQDYIISIRIKADGQAQAVQAMKQVATSVQAFGKTTLQGTRSQNDMSDALDKAAKRALIVAPIWMILRTAMTTVIQTTQMIISENMKLEESFNKIEATLSKSSSSAVNDMGIIRETITNTAKNSTVAINSLASAFEEFRRAGNTVDETMTALPALTTLLKTRLFETADAVSILDTGMDLFSNKLGKNLSVSEKYAKIADITVAAYNKWGLTTKTLQSGLEKLAPFLPNMSEDMSQIVAMIGLMNDKAQSGSRTGTSLGVMFTKLTENAHSLAASLNVEYDPKNPVGMLDFLTKIKQKLSGMTEEGKADLITKIFGGVRGSGSARLALADLETMIAKIKQFQSEVPGAANTTANIRSQTIAAAQIELNNALITTGGAFASATTNGADYAKMLKGFAEWLTSSSVVNTITTLGDALGRLATAQAAAVVTVGNAMAMRQEQERLKKEGLSENDAYWQARENLDTNRVIEDTLLGNLTAPKGESQQAYEARVASYAQPTMEKITPSTTTELIAALDKAELGNTYNVTINAESKFGGLDENKALADVIEKKFKILIKDPKTGKLIPVQD